MYRFAAAIDTRDWTTYRAVFTDEIDLDYSSYRPGSAGRFRADDWVARGRGLFSGLDATQHCLYNPLVTIDGDVADIVIYVQAEHFLTNPDGDNWFTLGGYQVARQCVGLQAGGEGGRTPAGSGGPVLLLDVLAQDRDGRAADDPAEQDPDYSRVAHPVVLQQIGNVTVMGHA